MLCDGKCCGCKALWGSIFSSPLGEGGPVVPKLKEVIKEVWNLLSFHLEISNGTYHGCHWGTSGSFHSVRKVPKLSGLFDCNPGLTLCAKSSIFQDHPSTDPRTLAVDSVCGEISGTQPHSSTLWEFSPDSSPSRPPSSTLSPPVKPLLL